ncbi:protein lingerer isoform X2 [Daktulosphaira vitifoliae]|uniref:protein lingerer isoform X2 n=1 Tax=Daktulosphaira vitifoliae TaxID=58002 RepID=UPI0021AA0690|nr:protein lingerer isoform X2 [Daktulosphaira vitifoliae]
MSGVKGVVNRSAKTSSKNNSTNTSTQNEIKEVAPHKVHEKEKLQPTAEQLRIAKIIDLKPDDEIIDKVKQVMQIIQKSEDEIVIALHDNSLDVALTIDALLEGPQESWSTTGKKKKNRANSVNKKEIKNGDVDGEGDWDESVTPATTHSGQNVGGFSERRGRGRGGRGGYNSRSRHNDGQKYGESRKWRDRENKENEKNAADDSMVGESRNFRSDSRGSRRGVNGTRFNGRSRGTRMFQNSERSTSGPSPGNTGGFNQPIDTWFNPTTKESKKENWGDTFPSPEDWDNEEYTGSLADTKVFTPSGGTENVSNHEPEALSKPNEDSYLEVSDWNDAVQAPSQQNVVINKTTISDKHSVTSKTLTPEQSQYLSSLTQESQLKKVTTQPVPTAFNSHPPVEFVSSPYVDSSIGPGKKPTLRARIPPPSKIPLSAVEMPPDDSSANINFLDVSFGAVEISNDTHLGDNSTVMDQNSMPVKYEEPSDQQVDSVLGSTEYSSLSNQSVNQNQRPSQVNQASQPSTKIGPPPGVPPPADYLSKQNAAGSPYQHVNSGQPTSLYNSVYSNTPQGITSHTSLYGTASSNISVNNTNPHIPQLSQSNHSILNANYPQTAAQPQFPSYSYPNPAHSYQASGISYPPLVSAANLASMYTPSTYSNYIHQNLHQTGSTNNLSKSTAALTSTTNSTTKDSLYEQSQTSSNSLTSSASNSTGNNISGTSSSIGLTQNTLLTSKTTTPTTNKSGVLSSMPPGVAPLVGAQYILSQQGIPGYYQSHPVMYSDEHLQMVQSRLPHHMTTNFYSPDPMYPTVSTSLSGRENAGAGITNVAGYSSLTDSRFTRTDNNASPVPSTLSQQSGTLAHQQTLLNPTITPSYTYYYGQSVIPANPFQYGTMYPMAPAANATSHGTGPNNTMSGYNKTAAAPAAYNNVYETLGSSSVSGGSSTDYGSSSKVGVSGQQTSQSQGKNNSSDLAAMYSNKSSINKPYDKQQQSFQSPPPFSVNLNNGGVGGHHSGGNYAPVFISPLPPGNPQPHHIAPLHHQIDMRVQNRQGQELSNGTTNNINRNQTATNKVNVKQTYGQSTTPYWSTN